MKSLLRFGPVFSALCVLLPAAPLAAADEAAAALTLTPAYVSQYMFRGVRLAGSSFQPGLEYARGAFVGGVWLSCPLQRAEAGPTIWETDVYASYTHSLVPDRLDLVPGVTMYSYPNSHRSTGYFPVTVEPSLALACTAGSVRFTPKLYYDLMLKGVTAELSAAFAVPLKNLGTELDFLATVGTLKADTTVAGADPEVKNWGDYWLIGASVPIQVRANSKLTLGLTYSDGRNNYFKAGLEPRQLNEAAVSRLFATVSYAITF